MVFRPGAWKDGGGVSGPAVWGGQALQARPHLRADSRKCDGTPGILCPQRHFFPPRRPTLTSKNHFPPHSPREKGNPARAHRSICCHSWAPFPADQFTCAVKMLVFPNQKQTKIKTTPPPPPNQTISLEISVDEMSQSQRHSPGTIPALKGSLHLPFYKKTTKRNNLFSTFHRSNQKKAGSFQL